MSNLMNKLSAYGVDVPMVMERFVDDEELYYDCLCTFKDDPSFEGLSKALKEENYEMAFDCAHTLKGVTANLGLVPLLEVICIIVEALRKHDYSHLKEQHIAINNEQEKFCDILMNIEEQKNENV